jgi:signal transduction histidine kinase
MNVTKRVLGESYITATGLLLGLVLVGHLTRIGSGGLLWGAVALLPVVALVASIHWVDRLEFCGEQIWSVAKFSAGALGVATVAATLTNVAQTVTIPVADTLLLVTTLSTATAAGALVGVAWELRRSNRRLGLRNAVLHRVLRHNLRNDMTVVLCLLDEMEAEAERDQRETIDRIRRKIEALVDLTDKVRQVNVAVGERAGPTDAVDIVPLVESRVERLRLEYPRVDVETDLPDRALARASGEFGLVLDNVVQCAAKRCEHPQLRVVLATGGGSVTLRIEDHSGAIPEPDMTAVTNGAETDFEHGFGMELWLVYWLVDASGGEIDVDAEGDVRRIDIELDRVTDGRLASRLP